MKNKTLAGILAVCLTFGALAGCSAAGNDSQSDAPSQAAGAAGSNGDESAAGNENAILIGTIQDLSGGSSEAGAANAWGVEYAVRVINEQGGVNGRPLEVIAMDCKNDVQEGVNCYRLLVDEKNVAAIVGPPLSNPALAWVDLSTEDEMPIVGHFMDERCTTNENTGEPYPYMFLAEPGCAQQSYSIAAYAMEKLGVKTVGTFYNAGLSYAVMHAEPFADYITKNGGQVLAEESKPATWITARRPSSWRRPIRTPCSSATMRPTMLCATIICARQATRGSCLETIRFRRPSTRW